MYFFILSQSISMSLSASLLSLSVCLPFYLSVCSCIWFTPLILRLTWIQFKSSNSVSIINRNHVLSTLSYSLLSQSLNLQHASMISLLKNIIQAGRLSHTGATPSKADRFLYFPFPLSIMFYFFLSYFLFIFCCCCNHKLKSCMHFQLLFILLCQNFLV